MRQDIIRNFKKVGIDLTSKNPSRNYFILISFVLILIAAHEFGHVFFAYLFGVKFSLDINTVLPKIILGKNFSPLNQKFEYIVISIGGMLFSLVTYWFILAVILLGLIDVFHITRGFVLIFIS